ncbi:protealysin inhibitor emfourin [Nonomuraea sp. NPDC046802]|uniref:protealysin inhibitor emfourin n=1 Tax=Nonomuraea sp. NPDC046802 TaxID=3154919 RepID=UPI003405019C
MRVKIERAGGFAGIEQTVAVYDTDDLPERQAAKVYDALAAIEFAAARGELGEVGADLMIYRITVGDGSGKVYKVPDEGSRLAGPLSVLVRPSG